MTYKKVSERFVPEDEKARNFLDVVCERKVTISEGKPFNKYHCVTKRPVHRYQSLAPFSRIAFIHLCWNSNGVPFLKALLWHTYLESVEQPRAALVQADKLDYFQFATHCKLTEHKTNRHFSAILNQLEKKSKNPTVSLRRQEV